MRIGELDSLLASAHNSGKLSLGLPLGQHLLPAVKALRYQDSLWNLDLSASKMDDLLFQVFFVMIFYAFTMSNIFFVQSLCEAVSTLPQLVSLNLRENLLTAASISRLAETLRQDGAQGLKVVVMSSNCGNFSLERSC